jgi:hypothetical protein
MGYITPHIHNVHNSHPGKTHSKTKRESLPQLFIAHRNEELGFFVDWFVSCWWLVRRIE